MAALDNNVLPQDEIYARLERLYSDETLGWCDRPGKRNALAHALGLGCGSDIKRLLRRREVMWINTQRRMSGILLLIERGSLWPKLQSWGDWEAERVEKMPRPEPGLRGDAVLRHLDTIKRQL